MMIDNSQQSISRRQASNLMGAIVLASLANVQVKPSSAVVSTSDPEITAKVSRTIRVDFSYLLPLLLCVPGFHRIINIWSNQGLGK